MIHQEFQAIKSIFLWESSPNVVLQRSNVVNYDHLVRVNIIVFNGFPMHPAASGGK